ncbi:FAD-dependent oxidoreductase [Bacillus sp. RG28]|uniref:FAD-dependent oxidoreductase n=1 Tax=Gottfriedia endophytica TaxID=2820819 RepID=A0A940NK77_9BACI|nr:FAD-dependent oxidoreductase [Gottfriedia endophytica]MBP0725712.1 FAD-dependent oxidoreductase [Gottfriedia endophytica]
MKNIIVLGGGYAGIHLIKSLKNQLKNEIGSSVRIILVDKNPYHFRKVLLFKVVTEEVQIKIPFEHYCSEGIEFMQGEVLNVDSTSKNVELKVENEQVINLPYDYLVIALGSVAKVNSTIPGGISLGDEKSALLIREQINDLIQCAKLIDDKEKQKDALRIAVVGGGITGIETVSELVEWYKNKLGIAGINPEHGEILLLDPKEHLLDIAPLKVCEKLEHKLRDLGVKFIPKTRVREYKENQLHCENGAVYSVRTCIVTNGLSANPLIKKMGLPLSEHNQLIVNDIYCVNGYNNIFAIGDCARVVDRKTNQIDSMTCKEAVPQAQRLGKILTNLLLNRPNKVTHKGFPVKGYGISLGPHEAFVWAQKWGIDFVITGKLGLRIRKMTWDQASLVTNSK